MALPTVLTASAATGIPATDREHFLIADSDEGLALAVRRLVVDMDQARLMGQEARRFVMEKFSWAGTLADLPEIVGARELVVQDAT